MTWRHGSTSVSCCSIVFAGMEETLSAHYWPRVLSRFGHKVRLIAPKFVEPYLHHQCGDLSGVPFVSASRGHELLTSYSMNNHFEIPIRTSVMGHRTKKPRPVAYSNTRESR
jgi:hypothetical protein